MSEAQREGMVYLVGAGPGDPCLITVKGMQCLERAEVVVYDYLVNDRLLSHAPADAERTYVGKMGGAHAWEQDAINELLVEKASAGNVVVRLKGGDPFVFGRGGEEALALAENGIPFQVVPGVTAAVAASAYAGIPVTHRGLTTTCAFVSGHEDPTKPESQVDYAALATGVGTVCFYMGVKNLPHIVEQLLKHGRPADTPVALIRWGTTPEQQTLVATLGEIVPRASEEGFRPPAIFLVGEVVRLREQLSWYEARPLFGVRVAVTRSREQASQLVELLESLGAEAIEMPTIRIEPPTDWALLDEAIGKLETYDWLIFTSVNGVRFFFARLGHHGQDARALKDVKVCTIGEPTAEQLAQHGVRADFVPETFTTAALAEELCAATDVAGTRILVPGADIAGAAMPKSLRDAGAQVDLVVAYRTVPGDSVDESLLESLKEGRVHYVTFTSSSTARNFVSAVGCEHLPRLRERVRFASIGPVTTETAEELGLPISVRAAESTIADLVRAIVDDCLDRKPCP